MDLRIYPAAEIGICNDAIGSSTAPGTLYHAKIRLFQEDIAIDQDTTLAILNAASATFAGYTDQTITFGPAGVSEDGAIEAIGTTPAYAPTDGVTPNNIWGIYIVDQAGDLAFAGRFDSPPIPMVDATSHLTVILRYRPIDQTAAVTVA